ncbi:MAG: electron transport complex subunit E [Anaerovoracaceae bacterium]|nr:electron transport complex subunit E [Anaerovoracaceae bacterium]
MKEKVSRLAVFTKGIIKENPNLVLLLGTCPTLATTSSAFNGMGMGIAATAVLICSNIVISLLAKVIPDKVRIPCYIVVIAGFVTLVQFIVQAFAEPLYNSLGVFLPLIVVNCIILGRAEMFANKNGVLDSALDGAGMGLGFTLSLTLIGAVREIIGAGTIFSGFFLGSDELVEKLTIALPFISEHPVMIVALAPGGFFIYACAIAVVNKILASKGKKPREFGCQGCAMASICQQEKCLQELGIEKGAEN